MKGLHRAAALFAGGVIAAGTIVGAQEPPAAARKARHPETRMAPPPAATAQAARSAAATGDPLDVALAYVRDQAAVFGLTAADVSDVVVTSSHTSEHNGVTHVYVRQRYQGIEVHGAEMNINVKDGRVFGAGNSFLPNLAAAISGGTAQPEGEAIAAAARLLGKEPENLSTEPIRSRLIYEPLETGEVALAWLLSIEEAGTSHMWEISLDATSADLFEQVDLTIHDAWPEPDWNDVAASLAAASRAETPSDDRIASVPITGVPGSGTYRVWAFPHADPNDGDRSLVTDPADPTSSPFGWNDTDGVAGAESTQTVGNNVDAYTDVLNDNNAAPAERADGGPGLVFDFPLDFTIDPAGVQPAATTNLFYWNNVIHDISYRYGFTEAAGNFQFSQYGKFNPPPPTNPGNGDYVRAEAQDGGGMNNANFGTNVDGIRPRMQMFLWVPPGGYQVQVLDGPIGNHNAVRANFRPFLSDSAVTQPTATVVLASPANACAPLVGFPAGSIAYADAGTCTTVTKATNARNAGAAGLIINTNAAAPQTLTGVSTGLIPVLGISSASNAALRPALPFTAKMAFLGTPAPMRDGDFDAGVIVHEYTHGISNRLTGGRLTVGCLNDDEQMGEGWSDFFALTFTHDPDRPVQRTRGLGPYIRFTGVDGPGIRPTRYSTDMAINPTTYGTTTTGTLSVPHGIGYAWTTALWEVYWNLIDKHGFNPNVYDSWSTGGNNLANQLVMDGLKLQPCDPGFVTGRDAVLLADQLLTGGENQCAMWRGFAKRGLGFGATQGSSDNNADNVEAFDLAPICQPTVEVSPELLTTTIVKNWFSLDVLKVTNAAAVDGLDLHWTITETATDCVAPTPVPWLTVGLSSGIAPPGDTDHSLILFNSLLRDVGTYNARLCVGGGVGAPTEVPVSMRVIYRFRLGHLKDRDRKAGSAVPIEFSLAGFQGHDVLAPGYPASRQVVCATGAPLGDLEPAELHGGLDYDRRDDEYEIVWKTSKAWKNTCRELVIGLDDGTFHPITFAFK